MSRPIRTDNITARVESGGLARPFGEVTVDDILGGSAARQFPEWKGQTNKPVSYWFAKSRTHVACESLLERTRLMMADFDPSVRRVKSQPLQLTGTYAGKPIRHIPDFLLLDTMGRVTIVNVKALTRVDTPQSVRVHTWADVACASRGWTHEVWTGANIPTTRLTNIRGLAGFRDNRRFNPDLLAAIRGSSEVTIRSVESELAHTYAAGLVRGGIMHLIWTHEWAVDLDIPIQSKTVIDRTSDVSRALP